MKNIVLRRQYTLSFINTQAINGALYKYQLLFEHYEFHLYSETISPDISLTYH